MRVPPPPLSRPRQSFQLALFLSVSLGVLITFAIALCATVTSPLATTVTGNIKDIVGTAFGWAMFGGFDSSLWNLSGLTLSFAGAGLYSREKLLAAIKPEGRAHTGGTATAPSEGTVKADTRV